MYPFWYYLKKILQIINNYYMDPDLNRISIRIHNTNTDPKIKLGKKMRLTIFKTTYNRFFSLKIYNVTVCNSWDPDPNSRIEMFRQRSDLFHVWELLGIIPHAPGDSLGLLLFLHTLLVILPNYYYN